jgi:8-oxo-dGTP pyrophosphatase MutT (NUDIX family)
MPIFNILPPKVIFALWKMKLKFITLMGGKIVGARALVIKDKQVLLIRHTYIDGWCTIGGTVDSGESARTALIRELSEEVGVLPLNVPTLHGVFYNNIHKRDDHVLFYIVTDFKEINYTPSPEIAEKCWFPLDDLPKDITLGTQRRIEEYLGTREKTDFW